MFCNNSILPLIMLLSGLSLYRPSTQNILGNDTDRIMEQATTLYRYVPPEGKPLSHTDIVEFITTGHASFKSHIDNLFETLPTLDSLFENSDSINTQPGQEGTLNVGIASESSGQTISGIHPSYLRGDAESAEFHSNHSSGSAGSSDVSSVFTQNGNNSSAQPMTDTRTSTSTSHSHEHQRDTEERTPFGVHQIIMVRNHSYQTEEPHLSLFDSGSSKNFILRDAVSKLNLEIHRLPNEVTVQLLGEFKYELCEYVEPDWQLQRRQKRHQNDQFLVVNALPNDYRMIIGRATYVKMGIEFFANESNLVAYLTVQKGSSKGSSYSYTSDACMFVNRIHSQTLAHKSSSVEPYNVKMVLHTGTRSRRLLNENMQLQEDLVAQGSHHTEHCRRKKTAQPK